jgi:hypothetical protein
MPEYELQTQPNDHHKRDSSDSRPTMVLAALARSHWNEHQTGWRIKELVWPARRHPTAPFCIAQKRPLLQPTTRQPPERPPVALPHTILITHNAI